MDKNIVGIIRDENDLVDVICQNSTNFVYRNEMGDNVVYSFFEDIEAVPAPRVLFENMITSVTEKMHVKGIPVKGFIFAKDSIVILQEDDVTAYIADPDLQNTRKVNVSVTTEDIEDDNDDGDNFNDGETFEDNDRGYDEEDIDTGDVEINKENQPDDEE